MQITIRTIIASSVHCHLTQIGYACQVYRDIILAVFLSHNLRLPIESRRMPKSLNRNDTQSIV